MKTILLAMLAVSWIAMLRRYPGSFATSGPTEPAQVIPTYMVCGDEPMPTWKRMNETTRKCVVRQH